MEENWAWMCGIGECVHAIEYCSQEWKGATESAERVREGYRRLNRQEHGSAVRRVRGDNFCAFRATIFQLHAFPHVLNRLQKR